MPSIRQLSRKLVLASSASASVRRHADRSDGRHTVQLVRRLCPDVSGAISFTPRRPAAHLSLPADVMVSAPEADRPIAAGRSCETGIARRPASGMDPAPRRSSTWRGPPAAGPARRENTPDPRPTPGATRPVRSPGRAAGGRDGLCEQLAALPAYPVQLTTLTNGKVERSHRTDEDEFYAPHSPPALGSFTFAERGELTSMQVIVFVFPTPGHALCASTHP